MKQVITIRGRLIYPLVIGHRACVKESNRERITSTVQRILDRRDSYILFETKNTVYRLMLEGGCRHE